MKFAAAVSFSAANLSGSVILGIPKESFFPLVSRFVGKEMTEKSYENQDATAELLNMIMGQLKGALNNEQFELKKAIPSIVHGKQVANLASFEGKSTILPYATDVGPFYIEIMIN